MKRRARYNSSLVARLDAAFEAAKKAKKTPELVMVVSALEYELPDVPGSKYAEKGASGSRPQAYLEALLVAAEKALPKKASSRRTASSPSQDEVEALLDFHPGGEYDLRDWASASLARIREAGFDAAGAGKKKAFEPVLLATNILNRVLSREGISLGKLSSALEDYRNHPRGAKTMAMFNYQQDLAAYNVKQKAPRRTVRMGTSLANIVVD